MKIENQLPLKDTCLKLQAIGFEFDSYFGWVTGWKNDIVLEHESMCTYFRNHNPCCLYYEAPTAQELLDKIPTGIIIGNEECALEIHCHGEYCVWFNEDINFDHPNLAEALAQMLIWLKEKSYI